MGLFEDLKERGLTGVQLVASDGHTGIQKAAEAAFLGAFWQMCRCDKQADGVGCVMSPYPFRVSLP